MGEAAARPEVLQALLEGLRDEEAQDVRRAAAYGPWGRWARRRPDPKSFRPSWNTSGMRTRMCAVRPPGPGGDGRGGGPPEVLQALLECLRDEDEDVRFAAARALGAMGEAAATPEVLQALLECLRDEDEDVRLGRGRRGPGGDGRGGGPTRSPSGPPGIPPG
jgi:NLR family CARD domain-containing protein 3